MEISAELVKRLRSETDAPLMECKAALQEANGDFERAKAILREKGKAAAAKRSDRSTSAGLVVVALSDDQKQAGAVVLESETDFVAKNDDFVALAEQLAKAFLASDPGSDPNAVASTERQRARGLKKPSERSARTSGSATRFGSPPTRPFRYTSTTTKRRQLWLG